MPFAVTTQILEVVVIFQDPQLEYINNIQEGLPESSELSLVFTFKGGKIIFQ